MRLMRHSGATLLATALVGLASSACGSDEEPRAIPAEDAAFLLAQLDETERRVNARACSDAERGNVVRIQKRVDRLPEDVDADVRDALNDSVSSLGTLIEDQCRPKRRPKPVETTPLPDIIPDEPETTTTQPETTTTQPETTTTQPEKTTPNDGGDEGGDEGGNNGNGGAGDGGNGGGNGNGGGGNGGAGNGGAGAQPGAAVTPGPVDDDVEAEG